MEKKLINLYARLRPEALSSFRTYGVHAFDYLKLEPALPICDFADCIIGITVDVTGKKDKIRVMDCDGVWYNMDQKNPDDLEVITQLYNRININYFITRQAA